MTSIRTETMLDQPTRRLPDVGPGRLDAGAQGLVGRDSIYDVGNPPNGVEMIEGVKLRPLKPIHDERGYLTEMLRSDWPEFAKFGQVYITIAYPNVVKGWHYHKVQTDNFIVVRGTAKVVCYDQRDASKTKGEVNEFFPGEKNPILIQIPPLVVHGFKAIGGESAYVVNVPSELYRYEKPDEYRIPYNSPDIPYDWDVQMK